MKRMIYQVCVGKPSNLYKHCIDSVHQYCKLHGIEHIVQRNPMLMIRPDPFNSGRSKEATDRLGYLPIFEKENAFDYLPQFDQVAIIDADIWIRPNSPNIFDVIDPDVDFAGVVEREMPITSEYAGKILNYSRMQYGSITNVDWYWNPVTGGQFFNMGMMVLNKSITKHMKGQSPKEFLERGEFKNFVDGVGPWKWSTDQTLLNYWVRSSGMKYQKLDWRWNGLFKGIEDFRIPDCHFVHFFLKSKLPNQGENFQELMDNIDSIDGFK